MSEITVNLISEGITETTFDEMIANAWYSVREFHIHLSGLQADGMVRDGLERAILQLTNMVPYRALAGFFSHSKEKADWNSIRRMRTYIREINDNVTPLPYILGESSKLKKEVRFHSDWIKMIQDNTVNILGWIQYEKVKWLQNNNSEVPGLIYKLAPMNEKMRKLSNVRKLWEGILEIQGIRDVFTGKEMFQSSMM